MRVAEGAVAILAGVAGLLFTVLMVGSAVPLVREHCITNAGSGGTAGLEIESGWRFNLDLVGASDSDVCVRNSPTREGLSAIGIWPLGTPSEQLGEATGESLAGRLGSGTGDYFGGVFALQDESAQVATEYEALQHAQTRHEALGDLDLILDDSTALAAKLAALEPPESLADLHEHLLAANQEGIDVTRNLTDAVQSGSRADLTREYEHFVEYARSTQRDLKGMVSELREEYG